MRLISPETLARMRKLGVKGACNLLPPMDDAPTVMPAIVGRAVSMPKSEFFDEHEHLVDVLRKGSKQEREEEAEDQADELKQVKAGGPGSGRHKELEPNQWLSDSKLHSGFYSPDGKLYSRFGVEGHEDLAKELGFKGEADAQWGKHVAYVFDPDGNELSLRYMDPHGRATAAKFLEDYGNSRSRINVDKYLSEGLKQPWWHLLTPVQSTGTFSSVTEAKMFLSNSNMKHQSIAASQFRGRLADIDAGGPGSGRHPSGITEHDSNKHRHIAVDFDGTLATHLHGDFKHLGSPIPAMIGKIRRALNEGAKVTVFTARPPHQHEMIADWTAKHIGTRLKVTNVKSPKFSELWDDRARGVKRNQGLFAGGPGSGCHGDNCGRKEGIIQPSNNLGIPRHEMPNVHRKNQPALFEFFKQHGVTWEKQNVSAKQLKPTQNQINLKTVDTFPLDKIDRKPITVSKDNYVVDGHHRWYKAKQYDMNVPIIRINKGIHSLLKLYKKFPGTTYENIDTFQKDPALAGSIAAGGPGSGCHGDNCGRKPGPKTANPYALPKVDWSVVKAIPPSELPLSKGQLEVEERFKEYLARDLEGAKSYYLAKYGNVINPDDAKELSIDYRADRAKYAEAVHEPASWLAKELLKDKLAQAPDANHDNLAVFTAGGAGAGKTTAINTDAAAAGLIKQAHVVYDSSLASPSSSKKKIDQALAAGKDVAVLYVHRDPVDSFMNGVIPRAEESGRVVPVEAFSQQHASIRDSMEQISKMYADNPHFKMIAIDNSHGRGNAKVVNLDQIQKFQYGDANKLTQLLKGKLSDAYTQGKVSRKVYLNTLGKATS